MDVEIEVHPIKIENDMEVDSRVSSPADIG